MDLNLKDTNTISNAQNKKIEQNRIEGHLYLVTEDKDNEIYLLNFTDNSNNEFKEFFLSDDLLLVAKEGSMLQYKDGKYELYSLYGYDMLFKDAKDIKDKKITGDKIVR